MEETVTEDWREYIQIFNEHRHRHSRSRHQYAKNATQKELLSNRSKARTAADDNNDTDDRGRVPPLQKKKLPAFAGLDVSKQGMRSLSTELFRYDFLEKLYLNRNRLARLPPGIRYLRSLTHLDVSDNLLVEIPGQIGMLTNLEVLLLFDDRLESLPDEIGYLYRLRILGLRGSPIDHDLGTKIKEDGTRSLINCLRDEISSESSK